MSNGIRFLEGMAIGGVLGFLAGILSAPKSGKELRQELLSESEDFYKQATESVTDVKTKTNQAIAALQAKGEDLVRAASEGFSGKKESSGENTPHNVN